MVMLLSCMTGSGAIVQSNLPAQPSAIAYEDDERQQYTASILGVAYLRAAHGPHRKGRA